MERITLKRLHTVNACQFRRRQNAVGQDDKFSPHGISSIRGDSPASRVLIPLGFLYRGVKKTLIVEAEFFCHFLAVFHDLEARREFHGRDIFHFFQQREIAIRFDVASNARITIPIPRTAHVSAFFAKAHVLKTSRSQFMPKQQASEPCPHDQNIALVRQCLSLDRLCRIDVLQVAAEFAFHRHVVCCAGPRFFEFPIFCLLYGIENGASGSRRQGL